ncbi:hypothetical protein H4R22_004796 [Coemansia sp. RSA 1290]|nr:hypothetical protein H4R22_004796 [Coemansia sp. RSA 1290]
MEELKQQLRDNENLLVSAVTEIDVYIQSVFMGYAVGRDILVKNTDSILDIIANTRLQLPELHQKKFMPEELQLLINMESISEDKFFFEVYHPEADKGKVDIEDK